MRVLFPPSRVLVRAPSWLGDFVASEPVLRALHARFDAAGQADRLSFAAPAPFLALLGERFAGARRIAVARGTDPDPREWRGHDAALLLDGSTRSAWCAFRAGIPVRIGWSGGMRAALLTLPVRPALERGATPLARGVHGRGSRRIPRPFAAACAELASLAGLDVAQRAPRIEPDSDALDRVRARLASNDIAPGAPFVAVNAGARPGSAKAADPAALARFARAHAVPIVLACGPGEEANARATLTALAGARGTAPVLAGTRAVLLDDPPLDLAELTALLSLAEACITADSGPRHLAQALGKPTTVLFGPTDPRHTGEHAANVRSVRVELDCSPCHREVCPLHGDAERACMRRLATVSASGDSH